MPRVNTATAAKDYPDHGIKKGQMYYFWTPYKAPKRMSATPPRQSQLTNSKMSGAYAAGEAIEDMIKTATDPQDLIDALDNAASDIRDIASEYEDAANAEPRPPGADDWEEKASGLNEWADDIDSARDEIESMSLDDFLDDDTVNGVVVDLLNDDGIEDPTEEQIATRAAEYRAGIKGFDDLPESAQQEYLVQAKEHAENVASCPL